jgi:hypothetical protein
MNAPTSKSRSTSAREPWSVLCKTDTLSVTHIFDGEEVITGGEDGQTWVATFANRQEAENYVKSLQINSKWVYGQRRAKDEGVHEVQRP